MAADPKVLQLQQALRIEQHRRERAEARARSYRRQLAVARARLRELEPDPPRPSSDTCGGDSELPPH